jgi:hypothetical protein
MYFRVLRVRGIVGVLRLLRDQRWVELLVAVDIARIDVLGLLAIGSLLYFYWFTVSLS